jgi:hypothetical protein
MNHLLALALLTATSAFAHGSSHPPQSDSTSPSSMVSFDTAPRVMVFGPLQNDTAADGQILICPRTSFVTWRDEGKCLTKEGGVNDWRALPTLTIPGFKIKGYEYRFVGSGGARMLVVYFEPIAAPKPTRQDLWPPYLNITGPITIKSDAINVTTQKVYIRRKP